jgi:lipopolysaccharide/colanic/teichoic acid biosynthesis glycosyltransferase
MPVALLGDARIESHTATELDQRMGAAHPHEPEDVGLPAKGDANRRASDAIAGRPADAVVPLAVVTSADETTPSEGVPELGADAARRSAALEELVLADRHESLNRLVNMVIAAVALVLLAPLMLLIAIAIRLTSAGPVLYTQTRVGIDRRRYRITALHDRREWNVCGRVFKMYKFRTMHVDAEAKSGEVWATKGDPRVTAIGKILRPLRLDELPQLYNVLIGDMNVVGPRPERPAIIARLQRDIAEYPLRHRAKPGITGLAQISHSYDSCIDDVRTKVRYDLEYLRRQSLAEDLRIMVKTVPVMLFRRTGW